MGILFRHGLLSTQEQTHIQDMIDRYPHAVLLNKILDYEWTKANLSIHESVGESCMATPVVNHTHKYGIVSCAFGRIYFFQEKTDYDKVCALPDIVLDSQPFMTFMPDSILAKIFK